MRRYDITYLGSLLIIISCREVVKRMVNTHLHVVEISGREMKMYVITMNV